MDEGLPERIQLRRVAGWRKPDGAVSVARPGKWGNPYTVADHGAATAVRLYQEALGKGELGYTAQDIAEQLSGKTLMCWCPVGTPCHGDILLWTAARWGKPLVDPAALAEYETWTAELDLMQPLEREAEIAINEILAADEESQERYQEYVAVGLDDVTCDPYQDEPGQAVSKEESNV